MPRKHKKYSREIALIEKLKGGEAIMFFPVDHPHGMAKRFYLTLHEHNINEKYYLTIGDNAVIVTRIPEPRIVSEKLYKEYGL